MARSPLKEWRPSWDRPAASTTEILQVGVVAQLLPRRTLSPVEHARALGPFRNVEPALHGRPRQAPLEPGRNVLQTIELNEPACFIKADDVAHPAEHRNVGDAVFVVHEPLPAE